jgi:hypothetical protein
MLNLFKIKKKFNLLIHFITKKHRELRKLSFEFFLEEKLILREKRILKTSLSFVLNPFGCCVYCRLKRAFSTTREVLEN